jgi:acid phosphatase type 7
LILRSLSIQLKVSWLKLIVFQCNFLKFAVAKIITIKYLKNLFLVILLVLLGFKGATQTIITQPYLLNPTETGMVIRWKTNISHKGKVKVTDALGKTLSFEETAATQYHYISVSGLKHNSRYTYSLWNEDKLLEESPNYFFKTAPNKSLGRLVRFLAFGDFGDLSRPEYALHQGAVRDAFLKKYPNKVDAWLWLGDNTYETGTEEQFQRQNFDFYGPKMFSNLPLIPTVGNHEYWSGTSQGDLNIDYFKLFATKEQTAQSGAVNYYSMDYANVHIICLDSYHVEKGKYRLYDPESVQQQWLIADLAKNTNEWTLILMHHPPYTRLDHNADEEEDLKQIRKKLTPIFDRFQVDLVLSGHSHVYERTNLIKGHTEHQDTFKYDTHVVQKTTGRYNTKEPPYINKTDGTVYVVAGTGGKIEGPNGTKPVPASVYNNNEIGGNLIVSVDENRMDVEWLAEDGKVKDRFTMFKAVNKSVKISAEYGQNITLSASWKGNYKWNDKQNASKDLQLRAFKSQDLSVTDSLEALKDNFEIKTAPQPEVATQIKPTDTNKPLQYCGGQWLNLETIYKYKNKELLSFKALLSDSNGSFETPTNLEINPEEGLKVMLPKVLGKGSNYKVQLTPINTDLYKISPSASFTMLEPAQVRLFANDATSSNGAKTELFIETKGSLPVQVVLNDTLKFLVTQPIMQVPTGLIGKQLNLKITNASNFCGSSTFVAENITLTKPKKLQPKPDASLPNKWVNLYPNPTAKSVNIMGIKDSSLNIKLCNEQLFILNEFSLKEPSFNLPENTKPGIYYVYIEAKETQRNYILKLVVVK